MDSIWHRLWRSSPASLAEAYGRRVERWSVKPGWQTVKAGPLKGFELYFEEPLGGGFHEMIEGTFDCFIHDELRRRIKLEDCVCWDIGGHFGYHSLALAAQGARVTAFEPNRSNAERFRKNREHNKNLAPAIELRDTALSDQVGEVTFVSSNDLSGTSSGSHLASALPPEEAGIYSDFERVTVPTAKADDLIADGCEAPKVIKLDVEGAELLVLKGAAKLFKEGRPLLFVEVHHIVLMLRIQEWLRALNYRVTVLDEPNASASRCFVLAEPA
jgi:FkbM family methyltransferase